MSHSYKFDTCFITSNIIHSAIIIWSCSNLTSGLLPRLPGEQIFLYDYVIKHFNMLHQAKLKKTS